MIKFFRRIRQRLLSENKFSKYFFYAIGEIILVVFGILIALQINYWSEKKLFEKEYISDLKTIQENLKIDAKNLSGNANAGEYVIKYWNSFYNGDTLFNSKHFMTRLSGPNLIIDNNGYKNAVNKGTLKLIKNDSLKNSLIKYYIESEKFSTIQSQKIEAISQNITNYYLQSGFNNENVSRKIILEKLKKQAPFKDHIKKFISLCYNINKDLRFIK